MQWPIKASSPWDYGVIFRLKLWFIYLFLQWISINYGCRIILENRSVYNYILWFTGAFRKCKLVALMPQISCSSRMVNAGEDLVCGRERIEQQGKSTPIGLSGLSHRLNSFFFSLSFCKIKVCFSAYRKARNVQS